MRMLRRGCRRFAAGGLLALAFLVVQNFATLHWLSHAIEATRADLAPGPLHHVCDECVALVGLGAGAAPQAPAGLPTLAVRHVLLDAPPITAAPAPVRLAFRSRAPPAHA